MSSTKKNKPNKEEVYLEEDVFYHPYLEEYSNIQDMINKKLDRGIRGSHILTNIVIYPYWVD